MHTSVAAPASSATACIWFSSMSIAASDISCGTLHALCFESRLSPQHHLSAVGSCATLRHLSQLSHDTQLLTGSSLTSCTGLARLLAVTRLGSSRMRLGRHLTRGTGTAGDIPSACSGAAISARSIINGQTHKTVPWGWGVAHGQPLVCTRWVGQFSALPPNCTSSRGLGLQRCTRRLAVQLSRCSCS